MRTVSRLGICAVALAGLAAVVAPGCKAVENAANGGSCDLSAKAQALGDAVDSLTTVSASMKASLFVACSDIASKLGTMPAMSADAGSAPTDDQVTAACNAAATAIGTASASAQVSVAIEGGQCTVDASAQLNCEASCDVSGGCDGGGLEARCDPGQLSGQCSGTCNASATCEGSATVAAQCQGSCSGQCTGTCGGNCTGKCDGNTSNGTKCMGMCEGTCDASCKGTCSGSCKLDANANISCGANVDCKGGCSVAYTAPKCEATLTPPKCHVDADCEAGCSGQASFKAMCSPPTVVVEASGNAMLQGVLEADLPKVFQVAAQAKIAAQAAGTVATSATAVGEALLGSVGCAVSYGQSFVTKLNAAAQASVSINVSVMASASVSGKTTSG